MHWNEHLAGWPLVQLFETRFLSFEIGLLKPDREAFDYVASKVGPPPGRVLFLDDNVVNVNGAIAAGFTAVRLAGVREARRALAAFGVLNPPH